MEHNGIGMPSADAGILRRMYELRSTRGGRVVRVEVDEGQMVAEDDEIVLLESDDGPFVVTTDVPGVVRELYVEAGLTVGTGAVVALIDEA
jgi:multidrug efflux pump subunit AcrA (membrane-fusion protein)